MLICFQAEKSTLLQSEKQRKSEKYIYKSFLLIINLSLKVENLFFLKVWKHDNTFKLFNCYLYFLFYMFTYLFYCNLYKEPTNYNNVRIINLLNCLCNAQRMKPGLSSDRKHLLFFLLVSVSKILFAPSYDVSNPFLHTWWVLIHVYTT